MECFPALRRRCHKGKEVAESEDYVSQLPFTMEATRRLTSQLHPLGAVPLSQICGTGLNHVIGHVAGDNPRIGKGRMNEGNLTAGAAADDMNQTRAVGPGWQHSSHDITPIPVLAVCQDACVI